MGGESIGALSCAGIPASLFLWSEPGVDLTEREQLDDEYGRLLASERAALAEAVAAQQRFRDLVNSVEGIVWEADGPTLQFSFVSKQAERILGYPVERW